MTEECLGAHREPLVHPLEDEWDERLASLDDVLSSILLLGENNPQSDDPAHALWDWPEGCAGNRLRGILGLTSEQYLAMWRTNLSCPTWSAKKARTRWQELLVQDVEDPPPWHTIVLLGAKVAGVARPGMLPFKYVLDGSVRTATTLVYLPHPSGRNLVWNDRSRWHDARALMREVAPGVKWGGAA